MLQGTLWKMCLVSKWAIFHFRDYGGKGNPEPSADPQTPPVML